MRTLVAPWVLPVALALSACGGGGTSSVPTPAPAPLPAPAPAPTPVPAPAPDTSPTARAAVGELLFHEPRLSASGRQSCASCHDAARGHADPPGTFLPLGGASLDQQGLRSSPSIRYLSQAGAFTLEANGRVHGGLFWDGRAATREEQARGPLLNPKEMANASVADFAVRLRGSPAWEPLRNAYSLTANASDEALMTAATNALALYQQLDPDYQPFTSKFDQVQAGSATFTAAEARGLTAFNDPQRGNCASCHSSAPRPGGGPALFTDFSYHALGVPRNASGATADPAFFDLGLCGPSRTDLAAQTQHCGKFRVPTLRNVALTAPYMHNAKFATLEEVVRFYATRDTNPGAWYPTVAGTVQRFNDLPGVYQGNVERRIPFGGRPGGTPTLSEQDVADIVAFLGTLTDR